MGKTEFSSTAKERINKLYLIGKKYMSKSYIVGMFPAVIQLLYFLNCWAHGEESRDILHLHSDRTDKNIRF